MTREEVFSVLSDERDFQQHEIGKKDRTDMYRLNMGSALSAIKVNLDKAFETWYRDDEAHSYQDTLHFLRKVAGLIVDQGEQHGIPMRDWDRPMQFTQKDVAVNFDKVLPEKSFINATELKFKDISSEEDRVYTFPNGNKLVIADPLFLHVSESGGHRLYDASGICYYVQPAQGWYLAWRVKDGEPNFVA